MNKPLQRTSSSIYHIVDGPRIAGPHSDLWGNVSDLRGNVSDLRGNVTGLRGDLDEITAEQRSANPDIQAYVDETNQPEA